MAGKKGQKRRFWSDEEKVSICAQTCAPERERITRRANEGRQLAIANGTKFGRKPKLTEHQRQLARHRIAKGDTCREIAKDFGVAHTTISRLR